MALSPVRTLWPNSGQHKSGLVEHCPGLLVQTVMHFSYQLWQTTHWEECSSISFPPHSLAAFRRPDMSCILYGWESGSSVAARKLFRQACKQTLAASRCL